MHTAFGIPARPRLGVSLSHELWGRIRESTSNYYAARKPNSRSWPKHDFLGRGKWYVTVDLSVAKEPVEYRRCDVSELHDASDDKRRQRDIVPSGGYESGFKCYKQLGDSDRDGRCADSKRTHAA